MVKIEIEDYNGNTTAILDFEDFAVADLDSDDNGMVIRLQDTIEKRSFN